MTTKIKNKSLIIGLFIVFVALFAGGWYLGRSKAQNASEDVINTLNGKITSYKYTIAGLEKRAYSNEQIIAEQRQAIEHHLIDKKELKALNFKKVNEVTVLKAKVEILLDSLKHSGTVITINTGDEDNPVWEDALTLPIGFEESTEFYKIAGEFDKDASLSLNLEIPMDLSVWTGYTRKSKTPVAIVTSTNPFVKINDILSVKMDVPKQRRFSIGVQAGYGIGKNGLTPYVGFGTQYRLF